MQGPYETFVHMLPLTTAAPTKLRGRRSLNNESMGPAFARVIYFATITTTATTTTTTTTRRRHLVLATKF